jgi:hypothetical protein
MRLIKTPDRLAPLRSWLDDNHAAEVWEANNPFGPLLMYRVTGHLLLVQLVVIDGEWDYVPFIPVTDNTVSRLDSLLASL